MDNFLPKHHLIFSVENPKFMSRFDATTQEVTKFLNANGEDAQIIEGHYGQPERSILVANPLNLNGIHQLAQDFGQESVLHSINGHHTLTFVNGPQSGQSKKGVGTNYYREKPEGDHSVIHTVDGPLYFVHNLDGEDVQKTEVLSKAPLIGDYSESIESEAEKHKRNIQQLAHKAVSTPQKAGHHSVHSVGNEDFMRGSGDDVFGWHYITDNNQPNGKVKSFVKIVGPDSSSPKGPYIQTSHTDKDSRGIGLSSILHQHAANHHGTVYSDSSISPAEHNVWRRANKEGVANLSPTYPTSDLSDVNLPTDTDDYDEAVSSQHEWRTSKSEELYKAESQPSEHIRNVANQYAHQKGIKLQPLAPVKVNPQFATQVAHEYEKMPHTPNSPETKRSYDSLINETVDQFQHLKNSGLKISKIKPGMESPYKSSKDLFHDVHNNNHMWYFPTESGFGSNETRNDHPMLRATKEFHEGQPMLANDVFRIVHDYFGHAKEGHGFGPNGEENAWQEHRQMYSPEAQRAMTAETRGQNSWVNFGPHAAHNKMNPQQTVYADQKAGLLPEWAHEANPAMKSEYEDLDKGLRGDWKKEGYKISHIPRGSAIEVHAHSPSGQHVGWTMIHPHESGQHLEAMSTSVHPEHQRKGVASAMYSHAENVMGKPLRPTEDQSSDAKNLWAKPDRTFGKSELEKGLMGDWQKEGYRLEHDPKVYVQRHNKRHRFAGQPDLIEHRISAYDKAGNQIGHYTFNQGEPYEGGMNNFYVQTSNTDPEHQRKGLATAAYRMAEEKLGRKLDRPTTEGWQSEEAQKLWAQPNKPFGKSEDLAKSKNVREQRAKVFGTRANPPAGPMRDKHIERIKDFARRYLGVEIHPSGGKIDVKTGKRRDEKPKIGVDKPDWRSGSLESQWNPEAMVHELAHLILMPAGLGLKAAQAWMDNNFKENNKKYGWQTGKYTQHEVQPMAAEQIIRRYIGLPASRVSVEVEPDAPLRVSAEDPNVVIGTRIKQGKTRGGDDKWVDLIRQSRFLHPVNRQRMEDVFSGKLAFHPEKGWVPRAAPTPKWTKPKINEAPVATPAPQAKLAASEKEDMTMERLANILEQKDDSEEIHMSEQLVNMWSVPFHKWNDE